MTSIMAVFPEPTGPPIPIRVIFYVLCFYRSRDNPLHSFYLIWGRYSANTSPQHPEFILSIHYSCLDRSHRGHSVTKEANMGFHMYGGQNIHNRDIRRHLVDIADFGNIAEFLNVMVQFK